MTKCDYELLVELKRLAKSDPSALVEAHGQHIDKVLRCAFHGGTKSLDYLTGLSEILKIAQRTDDRRGKRHEEVLSRWCDGGGCYDNWNTWWHAGVSQVHKEWLNRHLSLYIDSEFDLAVLRELHARFFFEWRMWRWYEELPSTFARAEAVNFESYAASGQHFTVVAEPRDVGRWLTLLSQWGHVYSEPSGRVAKARFGAIVSASAQEDYQSFIRHTAVHCERYGHDASHNLEAAKSWVWGVSSAFVDADQIEMPLAADAVERPQADASIDSPLIPTSPGGDAATRFIHLMLPEPRLNPAREYVRGLRQSCGKLVWDGTIISLRAFIDLVLPEEARPNATAAAMFVRNDGRVITRSQVSKCRVSSDACRMARRVAFGE